MGGPRATAGHRLPPRTVGFPFARLLAEHDGWLDDAAHDEDLLFAACVLNDLGLGGLAAGHAWSEATAPAYSIATELLRQRRAQA